MAFERFTQIGRGYKPKVSITKSGQIGFNQGAVKHFNLSNFEFAILYFDKDNHRIGIELTNDDSEAGVCKLRKRASGADISARSFFGYYGIDYTDSNRYDAKWDESEEKIIVTMESSFQLK